MSLSEVLRLAFAALGVNRLRSILTMLGITIGVFSVIGVMTAVSAMRSSIESGLSFLGANNFQFGKYPTNFNLGGGNRYKYANRRDITLAQAQRYAALMEGAASSICLKCWNNGGSQVVYGGHQTNPNIAYGGTDQNFLVANQYSIDYGRNLSDEDVALARPVVVIGKDVEKKLFPQESPVGKTIKVNTHTYLVIGVLAEKGTSFGQSQDSTVLVPITRFLEDNGSTRRSLMIATEAPSHELYNATLDKAIAAMRIARGLRPEQENDFEVYSNDSLISAFGKVADIVGAGALIISAIALLTAGVGIMNIMLVSVTERTKEIGIRKSIGAKKRSILTQFLFESVTLSLVGGFAGIVLGVIVGDFVAARMKADAVFPLGWATAGVLVCTAIGVGFGLYPAWKAASLDPIAALRQD
ncbi:MAG TPA: ABC transporter permease [Opitutaceae bacterium]|nr:ABC transporter permease [Opitutaceae bacterium]